MINLVASRPPDAQVRVQALDPGQSFIVQAPAGSGKTELLIQRILVLLATCSQPEEVLAITFTRKAAGEMKARLLDALAAVDRPATPEHAHERLTCELSRAVVQRDHQLNWKLVENPSRLQVMTIDSLCSRLVKRMPWLSRFGSSPQITDDPGQLYRQAVDSLLSRLDGDQGESGDALELLLNHLENRLTRIRDLLIDMLGRRDQWLRHVLSVDQVQLRDNLERALNAYIDERVACFCRLLGDDLLNELTVLADFAARQLAMQGDTGLSQRLSNEHEGASPLIWQARSSLVRTSGGEIRKRVDKRQGFPSDKEPECVEMKQRMLDFLNRVRDDAAAASAFNYLDSLPESGYAEHQWRTLDALLVLLPLAVVELVTVFTQRGQVDFVELAGAARRALGDIEHPEELLLQFDSQVKHILVDEFQDTSYGQYHLLSQLTSGWTVDDGRTLFVVGDPMQSIYRFREAEVGLYLQTRSLGLPTVTLTPLNLSANFRSQRGIIDWVNTICPPLFPLIEDAARGAVTYSPADATRDELPGTAVELVCFRGRQDTLEAETVVQTIQELENQDEINSVAILVRSRAHLTEIVLKLKETGIRFQAQEIDPLMSRSVSRDLLSLTRALLHPGDRVAWLSILRAPWCGLQADDLLYLCEDGGKHTIWHQLTSDKLQPKLFGLSSDGNARLKKLVPVLENCLKKRGELPLSRLVESCWLSIGGPACVSASELDDAKQFFSLLGQLDDGGDLVDFDLLDSRLEKLYASPDPDATDFLQVMTIHKAKGLEFDAVILPGLGRKIRGEDKTLLRWIDHPKYGLMLAPIPASDQGDSGKTYKAIGAINQDRSTLETLRMFYVAVTRARRRLYLYGHVQNNAADDPQPPSGSLLQAIWPAIDPATICIREPADESFMEMSQIIPSLRRLPVSWNVPEFKAYAELQNRPIQHASEQNVTDLPGSSFSLSSGYGRSVGTVVHGWLQVIAEEGLGGWTSGRIETMRDHIKAQLNSLGVPEASLDVYLNKVLLCLNNTISSERGRWLLSPHKEQATELAVHGAVDEVIVHAVIDRTFVDESGKRWVIDYKTTSCPEGVSLSDFLEDETEKYTPQLKVYVTLLKALYQEDNICCGLYFPMNDSLVEIDDVC